MPYSNEITQQYINLFQNKVDQYAWTCPKPKGELGPKGEDTGYNRPRIDGTPSIDRVQSHLTAQTEYRLGMISEGTDERCKWGVIDIDIFDPALLQLPDVQLTTEGILTGGNGIFPQLGRSLMLTQSKSGGHHIWLFSKQPILFERMNEVLHRLIENYNLDERADAALKVWERNGKQGKKPLVEHFPRSKGSYHFLNMPYYGDACHCYKYDELSESPVALTLEQFVTRSTRSAERAEQSIQYVLRSTVSKKAKAEKPIGVNRDSLTPGEEVENKDAPPCVVTLFVGNQAKIKEAKAKLDNPADDSITSIEQYREIESMYSPQIADGIRNNSFFQLATMYLKAYYPDRQGQISPAEKSVIIEQVTKYNDRLDYNQRIGTNEIKAVVESVVRKNYDYKCDSFDEPICNKAECVKRRFGKGKHMHDLPFDLQYIKRRARFSSDRDGCYILGMVHGNREVQVMALKKDLKNIVTFSELLFDYQITMRALKPRDFIEFKNAIIDLAVQDNDPSYDSIEHRIIQAFLTKVNAPTPLTDKTAIIEDIHDGAVYSDENYVYFNISHMHKYIYEMEKFREHGVDGISRHFITEVLERHTSMSTDKVRKWGSKAMAAKAVSHASIERVRNTTYNYETLTVKETE